MGYAFIIKLKLNIYQALASITVVVVYINVYIIIYNNYLRLYVTVIEDAHVLCVWVKLLIKDNSTCFVSSRALSHNQKYIMHTNLCYLMFLGLGWNK